MEKRTHSPLQATANKRVKTEPSALNLSSMPSHMPFGTNFELATEPTNAFTALSSADGRLATQTKELQHKITELEREKAENEKEFVALRAELEKLRTTGNNANTSIPTAQPQNELRGALRTDMDLQRDINTFQSCTSTMVLPTVKLGARAGYRGWRQRVLLCIQEAGCCSILEGKQKTCPAHLQGGYRELWAAKEKWLRGVLLRTLGGNVFQVMGSKLRNAFELWEALEQTYYCSIEEERRACLEVMRQLVIHDKQDVRDFRAWGEYVAALGYPIPGWLVADMALANLSPENSAIVKSRPDESNNAQQGEGLQNNELTLELIMARLPERMQQVVTRAVPSSQPATSTTSHPRGKKSKGGKKNYSPAHCRSCGKAGHTGDACNVCRASQKGKKKGKGRK